MVGCHAQQENLYVGEGKPAKPGLLPTATLPSQPFFTEHDIAGLLSGKPAQATVPAQQPGGYRFFIDCTLATPEQLGTADFVQQVTIEQRENMFVLVEPDINLLAKKYSVHTREFACFLHNWVLTNQEPEDTSHAAFIAAGEPDEEQMQRTTPEQPNPPTAEQLLQTCNSVLYKASPNNLQHAVELTSLLPQTIDIDDQEATTCQVELLSSHHHRVLGQLDGSSKSQSTRQAWQGLEEAVNDCMKPNSKLVEYMVAVNLHALEDVDDVSGKELLSMAYAITFTTAYSVRQLCKRALHNAHNQ